MELRLTLFFCQRESLCSMTEEIYKRKPTEASRRDQRQTGLFVFCLIDSEDWILCIMRQKQKLLQEFDFIFRLSKE